jgi:hypothetical protein
MIGALPARLSAVLSEDLVLRSAKTSHEFLHSHHEYPKHKPREGLAGTIRFGVHCVLYMFPFTEAKSVPRLISWPCASL